MPSRRATDPAAPVTSPGGQRRTTRARHRAKPAEGLVIDFDADGNAVGIGIQHASETLDLDTLEAQSLLAAAVKIA